MKNYIIITNDYYEIYLPESLREFGKDVLKYSTDKIKEYLRFFNEESYGEKIKGAFMVNRDDFISRIKEVTNPNVTLPPEWATGCFYGGETQMLIDENNPYEKFYTLAHETFHLVFTKFVYEKNNHDRVVWLDESLAGNFDGTTENLLRDGKFKDIIINLLKNKNLPKMNDLKFSKGNIITKEYNGYLLFKIVGRYLIETKNKVELLDYINDLNHVIEDGDIILNESLKYFSKKYEISL